MKENSVFMNLFGQIRIYSLIDLILFSLAIHANSFQFTGILLLHLGFLLFLEYTHKHKFRVAFPKYLWFILLILGAIFYNNIAVIGFLVSSFFYVKKSQRQFGSLSPFFRGLQYYFLAGGIIGYTNSISFLAAGVLTLRNFTGDLRDTTKDQKDGYKTLPIIFGIKKNYKNIHLLTLMGTTTIWWYLSGINIVWLIPIFLVQIASYNLTPR